MSPRAAAKILVYSDQLIIVSSKLLSLGKDERLSGIPGLCFQCFFPPFDHFLLRFFLSPSLAQKLFHYHLSVIGSKFLVPPTIPVFHVKML